MPAPASERSSSGALNHGIRRDPGWRRTSATSPISRPPRSSRKAAGSCVECPIVKMVAMADRLGAYRSKRELAATPEPGGRRFVVQEHHARRLHWDLRLEREGVLASWALPRGIPAHPDENRLAVRTEDHPLEYLEFEGEIPKGNYGAGTMAVWDSGTFEAEKFRDDEVIAVFHGDRLRGRYALFRTRGDDWLIHRMDPPEDPGYEPMPDRIKPMLARTG